MKTNLFKNKISKILLIGAISAVTILTAYAASWGTSWGSTNEAQCGNQNCQTFHNNGYTHSQYPDGLNFASFNGYKDAVTSDGRSYKEMQSIYIDAAQTASNLLSGLVPLWNSASDYNFANGDYYKLNFTGNETKRIGFWGYIHNNGEADKYPANNTYARFSNWSSGTPKTVYYPEFSLWASNVKPTIIWSTVKLEGNKAFTLNPVEAVAMFEDGRKVLSQDELNKLTSSLGLRIGHKKNDTTGLFQSSHLHYVPIYIEFEATPQEESKVCRSLNIVTPHAANDDHGDVANYPSLIVEDTPYSGEEVKFNIDTDAGVVSTYQFRTEDQGGIVFSDSRTSDIRADNLANGQTSAYMYGMPLDDSNGEEKITVVAMDENNQPIWDCADAFTVKLQKKEEVPCRELTTDPGKNYSRDLKPGDRFPINVETLVDENGNEYRDADGSVPTLQYCYTGDINYEGNYTPGVDITGIRRITPEFDFTGNETTQQFISKVLLNAKPIAVFETAQSEKCILAKADQLITVTPLEEGTLTIHVIGAYNQCQDEFDIGEAPEGECVDLNINQTRFTESRTSYSVNVETDPANADYNVDWTVERNGDEILNETTSGDEIDLEDYSYNFEPGDTLIAQATNINNADQCIDRLTTEEEECTEFNLDKDKFVRDDQEICFTTDWPYFDEVEYETSDGQDGTIRVEDDCFTLKRSIVEDATWIDIWVPDYENVCKDRLTYDEKPPEFNKNVRDEGNSRFVKSAVSNFNDTYVEYEILYTHFNGGVQDVTITDTIGRDGRILGYVGAQPSGGYIDYMNDSMEVRVDNDVIDSCKDVEADLYDDGLRGNALQDALDEALCYEGDIGNASGVKIQNVPSEEEVRVYYKGNIHSEVNVDNCSSKDSLFNTSGICGEKYTNVSRFRDESTSGSSLADLLIPCPYIIIRAGGDVLLENPFDYGVDTLACADIANADVPVITPEKPVPPIISKEGTDITPAPAYTDKICQEKAEGYSDISGISSLICEVTLKTSENLQQRAIIQNISNNKQKLARFETDKNLNGLPRISSESDLPSSVNNVYVKDDGNLELGNGSTPLTFSKGAKTIIVENGDVVIKSNIQYSDDESALADSRNIASLTIIVINGSILVDANVTETSGVLFVQEGDRTGSGQVCEVSCADNGQYNSKQFVHYGSIYGDIENLLKFRTYSGDPTKEAGAVVIRFDNRIYLNPSPVLKEILPQSEFVL